METDLLQLKSRIESLEAVVGQKKFSNRDVSLRFADFQAQLKIPKWDSLPSVCEIGQVCSVSGVLYKCSAVDTWTQIAIAPITHFENTFTAGETLALGDPVRLSVADTTIYSQTTTGTTNNISNTLANAGYATKLTIGSQGARVTSIVLKLQKVGSPIDSVRVQILPDNAGNPDVGTNYQTVDKVGSSLSTSAQDETFIFDTFLNEGTYWIAVRRTGSSDGTNYYQVTGKSAVADSNSRYDNNSSTWYTFNAVPPYVIVYGTDTGTTGTLLKANGLTFPQSRLIGLTKAAITSGDSGLVVTQGYISGLSSLTTGYQYYLSDTGTLATSPGTRTIYVGKALSSTELLVNIYE